jgi:hypothetical protein
MPNIQDNYLFAPIMGTLSMLMCFCFMVAFVVIGEQRKKRHKQSIMEKDRIIAEEKNKSFSLFLEIKSLNFRFLSSLKNRQLFTETYLVWLADVGKLIDRYELHTDTSLIDLYDIIRNELAFIKYELYPSQSDSGVPFSQFIGDFIELHNKLQLNQIKVSNIDNNQLVSFELVFPVIRLLSLASSAHTVVSIDQNMLVIEGFLPKEAETQVLTILHAYSFNYERKANMSIHVQLHSAAVLEAQLT